jgi:D-arabinose 1-dehydrogenase-like Zn-dependent alcohol dehydrogenase
MRAHEYFTFKIPDNISTDEAAPMMCAGLTTYSPLVRLGAGPGKKVAIVGMGGLGHYAVLWAVALGAEVYVLSHTPGKKEDAMKMGAKEFTVTSEKDWQKKYAFTFDFIRRHRPLRPARLLLHPQGHGQVPQRRLRRQAPAPAHGSGLCSQWLLHRCFSHR